MQKIYISKIPICNLSIQMTKVVFVLGWVGSGTEVARHLGCSFKQNSIRSENILAAVVFVFNR